MTGPNNLPLLILADAGKGRTGLLLSDQFWLWTKAAPHAGPALPLLRRIVHFLLREPALEPESLTAAVSRGQLTIHLQTLNPIPPASAAVTTPDGTTTQRPWHQASPGQFIAQMPAAAPGLYRVTAGPFTAYAASAAANAAEYQDLAATAHILSPLAKNIIWLGSTPTPPLPTLITQRHATQITGTKKAPLLPPACSLLVALTLLIGAWWRESGARL